jgi:hypothetical protein
MTTEHAPVTLGTLLRAGGNGLRQQGLPPDLFPRVEAAVRGRARRWPGLRWSWPTWVGGGVATVCTAVLAWVLTAPLAPVPHRAAQKDIGEGFVSLASAERWRQAAAEPGSAWLVSIEISQARAALFGLPYDPGHAGDRVRADLLMHASGDVLAVRLVP